VRGVADKQSFAFKEMQERSRKEDFPVADTFYFSADGVSFLYQHEK
jgi:hypothetical protein